nr:anti-phage dCTP deaminase [Nocardioides zhouii]
MGLVSPIGTDLERATQLLEEELHQYGYGTEIVRLSRLLEKALGEELSDSADNEKYYESRMGAGDRLRRQYGNDAVAGYAIAEILERRDRMGFEGHSQRVAWILWSLKHEEEVDLLRATYGSRFVLLGLNAPVEKRRTRLRGELQDADPGSGGLEAEVARLIERDQLDPDRPYGQHVRDAYCRADYFAELEVGSVREELGRFVGLIFGKPFITPTKDEAAMFLAFASSLRSSDAGRQVGAVIASEVGEVLAVGCNEVPKAGGGEYWSDDLTDNRDFQLGYDFNKRATRRALREVLDALSHSGHLSDRMKKELSEDRLEVALSEDKDGRLKNSRVLSLIEFGRIVHAEMSAITQAARGSTSIRGAILYTTAYPCHMCMRLIISSGVSRIVYVDPYPKSLAEDMYATELAHAVHGQTVGVSVEPFVGTSWTIYPQVFRSINRDRLQDGRFDSWSPAASRMRLADADPIGVAQETELQIPIALELRSDTGDVLETVGGLVHSKTEDEPTGEDGVG